MSIFSPCSSVVTARTREPTGPMQAPLAFRPGTVDRTAILLRWPASRAMAAISTEPVGDLGHLEREEPSDEVGVGARERDGRAALAAADGDDAALEARAVGVDLPGTCSVAGSTASSASSPRR
jgi:hypothetical protein